MAEVGDDGSPTPLVAQDTLEGDPQESIRPEVEELVLAVRGIDSFETPGGNYLVFSAVGCVLCFYHLYTVSNLSSITSYTSLFACAFRLRDDSSFPTDECRKENETKHHNLDSSLP